MRDWRDHFLLMVFGFMIGACLIALGCSLAPFPGALLVVIGVLLAGPMLIAAFGGP